MANFATLQQFMELVTQTTQGIYPGYGKYRKTNDDPSAELFDATGTKIQNIKVKFKILDDGGSWSLDGLLKPEFIWDMKKVSNNAILDDGINGFKVNLMPLNVKYDSGGLEFLNRENSKLQSETVFNDVLSNKNLLLNTWITPYSADNDIEVLTVYNYLGVINNYKWYLTRNISTVLFGLGLRKVSDSTDYMIPYIIYQDSNADVQIFDFDLKLHINNRQNIQVFYEPATDNLTLFVNGSSQVVTLSSKLNYGATQFISVGRLFSGLIHYITLQANNNSYLGLIDKQFKYAYPLPRPKDWVDLSGNLNNNSLNVLLDFNNVSKAIEALKGHLYMKTNNIKLKNRLGND